MSAEIIIPHVQSKRYATPENVDVSLIHLSDPQNKEMENGTSYQEADIGYLAKKNKFYLQGPTCTVNYGVQYNVNKGDNKETESKKPEKKTPKMTFELNPKATKSDGSHDPSQKELIDSFVSIYDKLVEMMFSLRLKTLGFKTFTKKEHMEGVMPFFLKPTIDEKTSLPVPDGVYKFRCKLAPYCQFIDPMDGSKMHYMHFEKKKVTGVPVWMFEKIYIGQMIYIQVKLISFTLTEPVEEAKDNTVNAEFVQQYQILNKNNTFAHQTSDSLKSFKEKEQELRQTLAAKKAAAAKAENKEVADVSAASSSSVHRPSPKKKEQNDEESAEKKIVPKKKKEQSDDDEPVEQKAKPVQKKKAAVSDDSDDDHIEKNTKKNAPKKNDKPNAQLNDLMNQISDDDE